MPGYVRRMLDQCAANVEVTRGRRGDEEEEVRASAARWALQHLPYSTAKTLRAAMGPDPRKTALLSRWESVVFRAAVSRLQAEHRLPDDWEALP